MKKYFILDLFKICYSKN